MNKERVEKMFREAGAVPVTREKIGDYELFLADGFSQAPHFRWQKFGIEPGDFPAGMYVTFWWIGDDDTLGGGRPMFMEPTESNLDERLNAARADAHKYIKNRSLRKKH